MEISNQERLKALLADPYYSDPKGYGREVGERFEKGETEIVFGEQNWPNGWYTDPYFRVSVPFALDIAQHLKDVKKIRVYYWRDQDFHHIQFEYDGDTYVVQWYKIWTLTRKSDGKKINFGFEGRYEIASWLRTGKHKTSQHWHDAGETFNPFNYPITKDDQP